jgi:hypothetical protein
MNYVAEIIRRNHCRTNDHTAGSWLLKGRAGVGLITTEHSSSAYGMPVATVDKWGGLIDYSDIKSISLMMPGIIADYRAIMDPGNSMEHKDFPRSITPADIGEVSSKLSAFGIEIEIYGG